MQSKTYKFGETEFSVQDDVFAVDLAWVPVASYYQDLIKMYTAECDMTAANVYKDRLKDLADKDKQDKSDLVKLQSEETPNAEIIERINKQIELNKTELDKINSEFANDVQAIDQQATYNRKFQNATRSLLLSYDVLINFLKVYLIGDVEVISRKDKSSEKFIEEVITDFFLFLMQSKSE